MKTYNLLFAATASAIVLGGCQRCSNCNPAPVIPCEWHSQLSEGMQGDIPEDFTWWEAFHDPILNSLIERMACQNLDLGMATARIIEARIVRNEGKSALWPHIDGTAAVGGVGYNQDTLHKILNVDCDRHSGQRSVSFFEVGFDAEWEIDLFGVHRHELCSLQAKLDASKEEFHDLWVSLTAELARNYIELRSLQQRLVLLNLNITSQAETLSLLQSLNQTGFRSTLEQNQAQSELSSFHAEKTQLERSIQKTIYRISVLLGYAPGELCEELGPTCSLPQLPCEKPIGIPSELLTRRPDIRKAEKEIAAASEMVASAVAAQFPRISLRGFIGDLGNFQSNSFTWFAGPQLLAPIFNSKAVEQSININKVKAKQAVYAYQKTVLTAFEETENAIASFHAEMERSRYLANAEKFNQESFKLTEDLYNIGAKDYVDVLATQRHFLASQDASLQSQTALLLNYVALYKALGGAWTCE